MNSVNLKSVASSIAAEYEEDYVGLWVVATEVIKAGVSENCVIEASIGVIRSVLEIDNMRIGQFNNFKFVFWTSSLEASLARIESEWKLLGRLPNLGEIAWIVAE